MFIEHVDKVTGDVMTLENAFHGLEDGDYVTFAEVKGMTELNDINPVKVTVKSELLFYCLLIGVSSPVSLFYARIVFSSERGWSKISFNM